MTKMKWIYGAAMVLAAILVGFTCARAQTPPVSMITAMPDSTFTTEIPIHFTVNSTIDWDQAGGVGIYYRTSGMTDWSYAGNSYTSPLMFTPPWTETGYIFTSTVADNDGNNEGYNFEYEAGTVYVPDMAPPDVPMIMWHWTHPTTGTQVVEYQAEWDVNGIIRVISGIAVGDTTYAELEVPYTPGQNQTLRVRGIDAAYRAGPWSIWGEIWEDVFPGQPGKPQGMLIITP